LLVADISKYPIITSYPILSWFGSFDTSGRNRYLEFVILASISALVLYLNIEKKLLPEKGVLFGYPIASEKRNGIMVNPETFAGG